MRVTTLIVTETNGVLERRLKISRPVADPATRMLMNLDLADAHFQEGFEVATVTEGLSMSAYNVLRILRGHPDGHPRTEIAQRMVYRRTDLTRLIDGLLRRGLAERRRGRSDRRLSVTRITAKGLRTLERLDPLINALIARYRRKLTVPELGELSRLLERLYADLD
jgi:DNA-binding MarR family transcriptional regulator